MSKKHVRYAVKTLCSIRRVLIRLLSRLAVNFTAGLTFSRYRSRLSRDFHSDSGFAFSLRYCSFMQILQFCYVFAFLTFFLRAKAATAFSAS